jgi:hypothetical protein
LQHPEEAAASSSRSKAYTLEPQVSRVTVPKRKEKKNYVFCIFVCKNLKKKKLTTAMSRSHHFS